MAEVGTATLLPAGFFVDPATQRTLPPRVRVEATARAATAIVQTGGSVGSLGRLYYIGPPPRGEAPPPAPLPGLVGAPMERMVWEEDCIVGFQDYNLLAEKRETNKDAQPDDARPTVLSRQLLGLWMMLKQQGGVKSRHGTKKDKEGGKAAEGREADDEDGDEMVFERPTERSFGAIASLIKQDALSRIWLLDSSCLKVGKASTLVAKVTDSAAAAVAPSSSTSSSSAETLGAELSSRAAVVLTDVFHTIDAARPFVAVAALLHKLIVSEKVPRPPPISTVPSIEEIAIFLFAAENHSFRLFEGGNVFVMLALAMRTENVLMKSAANAEVNLLKDNSDGLRFRCLLTKSSLDPGTRIRLQHSHSLTKPENEEEKKLFETFVSAGSSNDPKARAMEMLKKMGLDDLMGKHQK